jgi:hypothetical protein
MIHLLIIDINYDSYMECEIGKYHSIIIHTGYVLYIKSLTMTITEIDNLILYTIIS